MTKSPHRRRAVIAVAALVAVAAGVVVLIAQRRPPESAPSAAPEVKTTTVRKSDLTNTRSVGGMLGFGAPRVVKGAGAGSLTKLPAVGDVAELGKPLYRVDDRPVPVFFGDTPLFRKLEATGTKGADVAVVMDNLAALGYQPGRRPDDAQQAEFTPAVVAALKRWQNKVGLEPNGTLDVGQVLVLDAPARIAAVTAQLGDPATGPLVSVTANARVVSLSVPVGEVGTLKAGSTVVVVRPDGKELPAKVGSISTAVVSGDSGQSQTGQPGGGVQKMDVVVIPDDADAVADLDSASVQVKITTESRPGVLVVPVHALIALREGGYAVQPRDGPLKAVQTGMYSQNLVEITGSGIAEGLEVVTAS
ncbi:peptidoglycan-binding protein [Actinosynnema sp. CS-041913]|uniref:peptidoglycan-binding protein n=1 Tax=Actinosynnema sp. CS-041913 TaxID=3239917 RepID=UPI003D9421D5